MKILQRAIFFKKPQNIDPHGGLHAFLGDVSIIAGSAYLYIFLLKG